jgi:hypothetical protein
MERKQALWIISRYFKFVPIIKKRILRDMIELKLLERVSRDKIKIINEHKSKEIDGEVFIKIIEAGRKGYVFIFGLISSFIIGMFQK